MGIMQNLRDRTHIILWAILILFVLSMTIGGLVGGANILDTLSGKSKLKNAAGMVNKAKFEASHYVRLIQNEYSRMREQGQEVTAPMASRVADQVWNQFINETLISEQIDRLKLQASDDEIYTHLVENPPPFLQQNEAFLTDGQFDYQKYLEALNNPQGNEWYTIEEYLRATLPFGKLQTLVQSLASVSDEEIRVRYILENVHFDLRTVKIPMTLIATDSIPVSDDEIGTYYKENKEDYYEKEKRSLDYVLLELNPSASDTQSTYELLEDLRYRIENGESFETIAAEYTQDPSGKESGGDLGWFGRNQMVGPFEEAAFAAKTGELVGPVLTRFGYHLIKVEEKRTQGGEEQVKARHILLKLSAGPETIEQVRSAANHFVYDAGEMGFEAAADSHNVTIEETSPFTEDDQYLAGLGYFPRGVRFAFATSAVGTVSELMGNEEGYIVVRLADVIDASYKSIGEVREQIQSTLEKEKRSALLMDKAHELYREVAESGDLRMVQRLHPEYEYRQHEQVLLKNALEGLTRSNKITGTILALEPGQIAPPVEENSYAVLIQLQQREEIDADDYKVEKEVLRDQILKQKKNSFYSNWVMALREEAKIIDNRENLY